MFVHLFYWFNCTTGFCTTSYRKLQFVFGKGKERKISFLVKLNPCNYWLCVLFTHKYWVTWIIFYWPYSMWVDCNVTWQNETLQLSTQACGWFQFFNAAGLWIFFLKDSGRIFRHSPMDVTLCTVDSSHLSAFSLEMDPLP